jgi:hypothetical protein
LGSGTLRKGLPPRALPLWPWIMGYKSMARAASVLRFWWQ